MIKHGLIQSYKIPEGLRQDFAISQLGNLLSGMSQCWIGFTLDENGNKKIHFTSTTRIVADKYYGAKIMYVDSMYGFRFATPDLIKELDEAITSFAKTSKCDVIIALYTSSRVEEFLLSSGYEKYNMSARKVLK
jgi:hypothetical protein